MGAFLPALPSSALLRRRRPQDELFDRTGADLLGASAETDILAPRGSEIAVEPPTAAAPPPDYFEPPSMQELGLAKPARNIDELDISSFPQDAFARRGAAVEGPQRPTAERRTATPGIGRTIGALFASFLSPSLGNHILGGPQRKADIDYENQLQKQQDFDWSANRGRQQTQDAFDTAKTGADIRRSDAMTDYYDRRNIASPTTTIGDKVMQWNPQTERYDIEAGAAPVKNDLSASPFERWSEQNPDAPVNDWLDLEARTDARHRKPDREPRAPRATPGQFAGEESKKSTQLRRLEESYRWSPEQNVFRGAKDKTDVLSPDDFRRRKQQIQDDYENQIRVLGGESDHYEYPPLDDGEAKRLLDKATQAATDEGGVLDPDKATANFDTLRQREQQRRAGATQDTALPPEARAQLREGKQTTFANGQVWTLENGQPKKVK